ncbi:MAG: hypothetical protein WD249_00440 [Gaiellaceae bacterium]
MPECIVPGCPAEASNNLGIRLRRPDTSAIWAPNTAAHVCDRHAVGGARLTVLYEPTETGQVEVGVYGATHQAGRTTLIRQEEPVEELDEVLFSQLTEPDGDQ